MSKTRKKIVEKSKSHHSQAKPYKRVTKSEIRTKINLECGK